MILNNIITFSIKDLNGKENGNKTTLTLPISKRSEIKKTNNYIIYRAYLTQCYNQRFGTANSKTRAEVKGGGRKPWRQKGTGRARAGSNTSPLWKGGGVSFGPKPKLYSNKINKKEWRVGLRSLLYAKQKDIIVIDNLILKSHKTNEFIKQINLFDVNLSQQILIIVPKIETNLLNSTRNLKKINITVANNLNIKQVLLAKQLIISKDSLKIIEETYND
ncbi:unnamed protein product [Discosporangium mesarthrocarpum]